MGLANAYQIPRDANPIQTPPRRNIVHQRITYEIQAAAKECYTAIKS